MAATKEYQAAYYQANKETIKAQARARAATLTPEVKAKRRATQVANGNKRSSSQRYNDKLRLEVLLGYGGACACCGTTYLPHLTLDHVDGGGHQERASKQCGGRAAYVEARRDGFPPKFQVLCWNCNSAKHFMGACSCKEG